MSKIPFNDHRSNPNSDFKENLIPKRLDCWCAFNSLLLSVLTCFIWAKSSSAAEQVSNVGAVCDNAAAAASERVGVPLSVLRAVTRNETGRKRGGQTEPWPWTVNMEGEGHWFDGPDQAKAFVFEHFKAGARSFDVGCFQINYKWHGSAFGSIEDMFDPKQNAEYAANFLAELYAEKGDWLEAVGAFHSRTPEYNERYKSRYETILASLQPVVTRNDDAPVSRNDQQRENNFPLLKLGSAEPGMGSLVPISNGRHVSSIILPEG